MSFKLHASVAALAFAIALAPAHAAPRDDFANGHLLTTVEDLAAQLSLSGDRRVVLVDVRPAQEYEAGHIPGALHLDPDAVADAAATVPGTLRPLDEIAGIFAGLGITADRPVIFYDDKGGFHAARMFWLAEYLGHRHVYLLDGGLTAWEAGGMEIRQGREKAMASAPLTFAPAPRRIASADWILERREDPATEVIDVRPETMFADGHIPWAHNIAWKGNLAEDMTFRPAQDLMARYEAFGVVPDDNVVVHCQNGLASSHSYVALRLLGFPRVRVYHRSWAEWGTADDLPKSAGPKS